MVISIIAKTELDKTQHSFLTKKKKFPLRKTRTLRQLSQIDKRHLGKTYT